MLAYGQQFALEKNSFPPVSFVIPAHNEAKYLRPTLAAIQKLVRQLQLEAELIVVSDASTDETVAIAREAGARVIEVELRNIGAVRNVGAAAASHECLFFIDADTVVPQRTVELALQHFEAGGIGGGARVDLDEPQKVSTFKYCIYMLVVMVWQVLGHWAAGCFMFCRKSAFDHFGGFNEEMLAAEEYGFSRNLKKLGRFRIVHHPVITSSRKFQDYSLWQLLWAIVQLGIGPLMFRNALKSRGSLGIWYQTER